jgi:hypothetical protein
VRGRLLLANFDICGTGLKQQHVRALDYLMNQIQARPITEFRIERIIGHSSEPGSQSTNQRLSDERAEGVTEYLADVADRMAQPPAGTGSRQPIRDARGREEPLNRSVEIEYYLAAERTDQAPSVTRSDRTGGTSRWQVRLWASGSLGEAVGVMAAHGQLRRQPSRAEPEPTVHRFEYVGYGLVLGTALPSSSEDATWEDLTTSYSITIEDFDGTLCRLTSLGYGAGLLGTRGYALTYFSFPMLGPTIDVGGASSDTGYGGGTSAGICNVSGL